MSNRAITYPFLKRLLELPIALISLLLLLLPLSILFLIASYDTRSFGIFAQRRVGRNGHLFYLYKIKTMRDSPSFLSTCTTSDDPRVTRSGKFFRKFKLDELPQLLNVVIGDMSFVGPRPDVPGYADTLPEPYSAILKIRPGITGPASLIFRDEENILSNHTDPEAYARHVLWPMKVDINVHYLQKSTFVHDVLLILATLKLISVRVPLASYSIKLNSGTYTT